MSSIFDNINIIGESGVESMETIKKTVTDSLKNSGIANEIIDMVSKALDLQYKFDTDTGSISDGYHTFDELYHHRAILFASLCNTYPKHAWKSKQHHDPNQPMYDGMFIVGMQTPDGQATYHYDIDPYWDIFNVKELERAPEFDGHTPDDAIKRIGAYCGGISM